MNPSTQSPNRVTGEQNEAAVESWLVRTAQNQLSGPYARDEIIELISEGALGLQDEICRANHYWIYLHEHEELKEQLGIVMPVAVPIDDEATETDTEVTRTNVIDSQTQAAAHSAARATVRPSGPLQPPAYVVIGKIERISFWKAITWVLLFAVGVLIAIVLSLLRT